MNSDELRLTLQGVSTDQLHDLVGEALVRSFDEQAREALVRAALAHLLEPQKDYRGNPEPSRIQVAFENAVMAVARETAERMVRDDPKFHEEMESVLQHAYEKVFYGRNREELVAKVAEAFARTFTEYR